MLREKLLFLHAMRVFAFASIIGMRRGIAFDAELLYAAALFHGIGLTEGQRHRRRRDEIDGANVAHAFPVSRFPADTASPPKTRPRYGARSRCTRPSAFIRT